MERTDIEQWKGREVARLLALVETERRYYQEMVATLPVALAVLASSNVIVSANRAFRDTFDLRPDQVRRMTLEQLLPSAELLDKINDARKELQPQESFFLESDARLFRISIVSLRNWDDETELETLLMVTDVTDVRQEQQAKATAEARKVQAAHQAVLEQEAKQAEAKQRSIVDEMAAVHVPPPTIETAAPKISVIEPIAETTAPSRLTERMAAVAWVADASQLETLDLVTFQEVSASCKELLGYTPEYWSGNQHFFFERIHPEDRPATMALYKAAIEHKQEVSAEYRAQTASGSVIWCRESIRPAADGTVAGVLLPIGPRKQMEQQRITAERHAALQLLSAQLAHDLNNPLMIITGYAEEMLNNAAPNDPRRGDLEQILNATIRIAGLTSHLLHFTRRPETTTQTLELAKLLREMKEAIERSAGGGVYLHAEDAVWAMANQGQLQDLVLSLVAAVQGAPEAKIAVTCGTSVIQEQVEAATLRPGTYACVTVRNDGQSDPGLDANKRAAMFETIVPKGANTSSTLTQAYSLVHAWGGELSVTGDMAQGTCFTLYLPLREAPVAVETPQDEEAAEPVVQIPVAKEPSLRETILVVDDEPGIRALVAKILRRERYDVVEAGNADDAIKAAAGHSAPIQLLLTDVMLPDRSGRQVAEQLRAANSTLKVLYISGFTDDESVRAGEFPPGSRFLQKPFTVGALVGKVREALDQA